MVRLTGRAPFEGHRRRAGGGTDDGGVDGEDPVEVAFGVGLGEQGGENLLPGPSTMSTVSSRNRVRGLSVSRGPRMMRSAADVETPNSGASCRSVKLVRQYAVTSTRSSNGRLHGRPLRTASAPSCRSCVTNVPKQQGLNPVNRAIQDGRDAVITPVTAGASHGSRRGWCADHLLDRRRSPDQVSHRTRPEPKEISSASRPLSGAPTSLTASTVLPR